MKDKTLLKLSLAISITGIIALFVLTEVMEVPDYSIAEALKNGGFVKISGTVKSIRQSNSISFLVIADDSGEIDAVLFDKTDARKGNRVSVSGKIGEYKGKKQIEAKEIIRLG